ncbi:RagB/SusD family nutrient uptake outer membrane protein [Flavobacterium sp. A45]|nr:RagB/SusD family nutrient uptake outer membrane protein [Flavobacterium sp. A45]
MAHANTAFQAIDELGNLSSLNPQKGEALLARAYSNFMLVNLWSKR